MKSLTITPEIALKRLMATCSKREMCEQQALDKLRLWKIEEQEQAQIMQKLVSMRFIDNIRYAQAYAKDKLMYSKWGAKKVEMMLRAKRIDSNIIEDALAEYADKDQQKDTLKSILESKKHSLRNEEDPYKLKQKLIRFAISRGFSYDDILDALD